MFLTQHLYKEYRNYAEDTNLGRVKLAVTAYLNTMVNSGLYAAPNSNRPGLIDEHGLQKCCQVLFGENGKYPYDHKLWWNDGNDTEHTEMTNIIISCLPGFCFEYNTFYNGYAPNCRQEYLEPIFTTDEITGKRSVVPTWVEMVETGEIKPGDIFGILHVDSPDLPSDFAGGDEDNTNAKRFRAFFELCESKNIFVVTNAGNAGKFYTADDLSLLEPAWLKQRGPICLEIATDDETCNHYGINTCLCVSQFHAAATPLSVNKLSNGTSGSFAAALPLLYIVIGLFKDITGVSLTPAQLRTACADLMSFKINGEFAGRILDCRRLLSRLLYMYFDADEYRKYILRKRAEVVADSSLNTVT